MDTDGDDESLDEVLDDEIDDVFVFLCLIDDDFIFFRFITCGVDKLCLSDKWLFNWFDAAAAGGGIIDEFINSCRLAAFLSNSQLTRSIESKKPEQ